MADMTDSLGEDDDDDDDDNDDDDDDDDDFRSEVINGWCQEDLNEHFKQILLQHDGLAQEGGAAASGRGKKRTRISVQEVKKKPAKGSPSSSD